MKKKTFFLSSLVAVAFFVAAISFVSCNKEDVDYNSVNVPTYVVTPDNPKSGESYACPWCGTIIAPDHFCIHHYGYFQAQAGHLDSVYCTDPTCPCYEPTTDPNNPAYIPSHDPQNPAYNYAEAPLVIKHFHVFDVCDWGHASHFHVGGGSANYSHHTNITH